MTAGTDKALAGLTALVTGGTRGIGQSIAQLLGRQGAKVLITGRSSGKPDAAEFLAADFLVPGDIERLCVDVAERRIDILVNNAGINRIGPFASIPEADVKDIWTVNAYAPFRICQAVLPGMVTRRWGRIVNISSIFGVVTRAHRAPYSASKFGLDGMTASLAAEVAEYGVLANCVAPGFVETDLTREVLGAQGMAEVAASVPMRRMAQPEEVAALVAWVVSPSIPTSLDRISSSTVGLHVSDQFSVRSQAGEYPVAIDRGGLELLVDLDPSRHHLLVDGRVWDLHRSRLEGFRGGVTLVDATEREKSLERMPAYVEQLVEAGVRRGHSLVAVGGGIVQDIACFLSAVLMRGIPWTFYPTTLLAQADSCIGSKSSINVGRLKNIVGTFTPPSAVWIETCFLETLSGTDLRSGLGEILKVYALAGPDRFAELGSCPSEILSDRDAIGRCIAGALFIKKAFIEEDEFDRGVRNLLNYGHTFGHALESATDFGVPHGIAVTVGMDLASKVAFSLGRVDRATCVERHHVLRANYAPELGTVVDLDRFLKALLADKKSDGKRARLILPSADWSFEVVWSGLDGGLWDACVDFLEAFGRAESQWE